MKKDYQVALRGHHLRLLYTFHFYQNGGDWIRTSLTVNYSKRHAENTLKTLRKITNSNIKVKIVETIDDICKTCKKKKKKECRQFIPYGISATCDDRGTAHYYGFKINRKKPYTAQYILRRLKEKGKML